MSLAGITYCTIIVVWIMLFGIHYVRPKFLPHIRRSLIVLFIASVLTLAAWVTNWIWLSLAGSITAVVGVSLNGAALNRWFKDRFNIWALWLWVLWFTTISLIFAHTMFLYRSIVV